MACNSGADVWVQYPGGRWDADEGYEGAIGFEWDRVALHRMLTKIISQPQADNRARRLPRLKARRRVGGVAGGGAGAGKRSAAGSNGRCPPSAHPAPCSPAPSQHHRRSCCTMCRRSRPRGCTPVTSAWSWTPRRRPSWGRAWGRARVPRPPPCARPHSSTACAAACAPRACAQATTCRWRAGGAGGLGLLGAPGGLLVGGC